MAASVSKSVSAASSTIGDFELTVGQIPRSTSSSLQHKYIPHFLVGQVMSIAENDRAVTFIAHHFSGHPARRKGNYTVNND